VLGWAAAGAGLLLAALQTANAAGTTTGGAGPSATGPALSLAFAGLGGAALLGAQVLPARVRRGPRPRLAGRAVTAAAVVAVAAPALVLAAAATAGAGPAARVPGLPAVAAAEAAGPYATRTLVLRVGGSPAQVRWALARGAGPVLGDGSAALAARPGTPMGPSGRDAAVVLPVLARLLSGAGHDTRAALTGLAVGSVVLLPPTDPGTVLALDAAPGLSRLAGSGPGLLWRVDPPAGWGLARPARARVVDPATGRALFALPSSGDAVDADLPAGGRGRLVVLAERADADWDARLDGVRLPSTRSGWAQAFVLPAHGGHLEVTHGAGGLAPADPGRAALLALAVLLALPLPRLRGRTAAPPPPRPSRPVPRPMPAPDDLLPGAPPQIFDEHHPEDTAPPLYVGPPPRRLRGRRKRPGGRT
jgi:hypothetical protein